MNILREFFETDFAGLPHHTVSDHQRPEARVDLEVRVHYDFAANSKFVSCFFPAHCDLEAACEDLLVNQYAILAAADSSIEWIHGVPGDVAILSSDLRFAGRLFAYHEDTLPNDVSDRLRLRAEMYGTSIKFRGPGYVMARVTVERPLAFILHDERDTNHIARPLAQGLARRGCLVWFHGFSLNTEAKPSTVFADGVKQAACCILVVSPNMPRGPTWSAMEFHRIVSPRLKAAAAICGVVRRDQPASEGVQPRTGRARLAAMESRAGAGRGRPRAASRSHDLMRQ